MKERYGEWTVLSPSHNRKYYSICKCSCGVIKEVNNSSLRLGKSLSCGHLRGSINREANYEKGDKNIIGHKFGRLKPIKRVNTSGESIYLCQCDCGNTLEVKGSYLISGGTMSCGCLKKENSKLLMSEIMEKGHIENRKSYVEGTSLNSMKQKTSKNSRTGVKGVSEMKNGKYRAYINIRRKHIHLGTYDSIEEARLARLEAEDKLYKPILDSYTDE